MPARECSRTACSRPAVSTLTYVYADRTAVLGPLSRSSEPHAYDLCAEHAGRLTAPRGWELIRVEGEAAASDDLVALADALRPRRAGASAPSAPGSAAGSGPATSAGSASSPRSDATSAPRHLHLLRSPGHE